MIKGHSRCLCYSQQQKAKAVSVLIVTICEMTIPQIVSGLKMNRESSAKIPPGFHLQPYLCEGMRIAIGGDWAGGFLLAFY